MRRLGKYTGTLYPIDYDFSKCPECCTCISDEEAENETFLIEKQKRNLITCLACNGCPAAQGKEDG